MTTSQQEAVAAQPPLPEPDVYHKDTYTEEEIVGHSADQMREHARAAQGAAATLLKEAISRINDMLQGDDGKAFKEAQRFVDKVAPILVPESLQKLHVGDSSFEGWFSEYQMAHKGTKQIMRDAYAAGMEDPLVAAVLVTQSKGGGK